MITRLLLAALLLAAGSRPLAAQANAEEMLDQAVALYEELQVERALALFRRVVSPSIPYEVSRAQRVRAYTYIGAALALRNMRDSAVVYFRAALERDPFTDLDSRRFTAVELTAFQEAKQQIFALAVRVERADTIDPRSGRLPLLVVTTHAAQVNASIQGADGEAPETIFNGTVAGLRELSWNGVRSNGRLIEAGRYEVVVAGRSEVSARADTARTWVDIRLDHPALEDTLPPLTAAELLPERHPPGAARRELAKGLVLAAAAMALPSVAGSRAITRDDHLAVATAAVTFTVGTWGFVRMKQRGVITENVEANRRRQAARAMQNAAIRDRNTRRLLETRLLVTPAAGRAIEP